MLDAAFTMMKAAKELTPGVPLTIIMINIKTKEE
jgi:hypothetical protein